MTIDELLAWTSDHDALASRRRLNRGIVLGAALLVAAIAAALHAPEEPHALEELVEGLPGVAGLFLGLVMFLRVAAWRLLDVDLRREVELRPELLRELARRLDDGRYVEVHGHGVVSGRLDGVGVDAHGWVDPTTPPGSNLEESASDRVVLRADLRTPWRVTLRYWPRSPERAGAPRPEGWAVLDGVAPPALASDLGLRAAVQRLLDEQHITRLRFDARGLSAEVAANRLNLQPERTEAVLGALIAFGRAHAAGPLPGIELVARPAAETCPFCKDALRAGPRATCAACGTAHHDACLAETGCTVLGCAGQRAPAERARAR